MPNLIKQGEAKVVTKNGEVFVNIALELNIKLDGSNIQLSNGTNALGSAIEKQEDKINWEIPAFEPTNKIQFGK